MGISITKLLPTLDCLIGTMGVVMLVRHIYSEAARSRLFVVAVHLSLGSQVPFPWIYLTVFTFPSSVLNKQICCKDM